MPITCEMIKIISSFGLVTNTIKASQVKQFKLMVLPFSNMA